ncbi:MAG: hypothetical protein L3K26_19950, partial [Candidatus Hydrogenedentes bacterium]|nr:hypothetical protein [Candidatus Hydrogenedentota bacterium]
KINLSNSSFWGPLEMAICSRSSEAQLSVSNTNFCNWDINGEGVPAVRLDAGKAILQGNTFDDGRTHVLVGEKVTSAILMGNQGGGGFRCENRAGDRTQLIGNEQSLIKWTDERKGHYKIDVGSTGDGLYLTGWHGKETAPEWGEKGTRRWSRPGSRFLLPVNPGKNYQVSLTLRLPEHAIAPENGLYRGEKRIATFPDKPGDATVVGSFHAEEEITTLTLRVKPWRPSEVLPSSGDARSLGAAVRSLIVQEEGRADQPLFNANTGEQVAQ